MSFMVCICCEPMYVGAGLSAASGIPTFRGTNDSIWVQRAAYWGTKAQFMKDPCKW